jgi:hypothetical protein
MDNIRFILDLELDSRLEEIWKDARTNVHAKFRGVLEAQIHQELEFELYSEHKSELDSELRSEINQIINNG